MFRIFPPLPPIRMSSDWLAGFFDLKRSHIHEWVRSLPPAEIRLGGAREDVVQQIVDEFSCDPVVLGEAVTDADVGERKVDYDDPRYRSLDDGDLIRLRAPVFTVRVPVEDGNPDLLARWPEGSDLVPLTEDTVYDSEAQEISFPVLWHRIDDPSHLKSRSFVEGQIAGINRLVDAANSMCNEWNEVLPALAEATLARRRAQLDEQVTAGRALGLPIRESTSRPIPFRLPRRRRVSAPLPPLDEVVERGDYPLLTSQDFLEVLMVLRRAQQFLAEHPRLIPGSGVRPQENDLRDLLLLTLNEAFRDATGESFSQRGKTDVRVLVGDESTGRAVFKAECKIWKGPASAGEAYEQLTDRYLPFREARTAIVLFTDGPEVRRTARQDAVTYLVENHQGVRLRDVAGWPVLQFQTNGGDKVDVAIAILDVTDGGA
jgi:hypothetical protein